MQLSRALWLTGSQKVVVRLLARAAVSSAQLRVFISELTYVAGLGSLWVAGLRAPAPCWLVAGASLSSLPRGHLHRAAQSAGFPQ